ncbi:NUDIX domain-containing protein [Limnobacter parvus]|uniref:NUDIX domain-containing protein n=1 Tax=Limnobacter parvus TaxID=2939690 RepID=A0ABT1XGF6_9BURK|nr:NUDIX domain-containing protein [Limnobacter parvus]MCR2745382.1 NUDIX domain-containing protein [Limnobacter parvus]
MRIYLAFATLALSACSSSNAPPAGLIAYSCVAGEALHLLAFDPHPSRRSWATLGGSAQKDETPNQTAVREFTEESNCAYSADEIDISNLKGPSISPGTPFHLYATEVPFKSAEQIAEARQCASIERSQWVWVRHLDLLRAVNGFNASGDAPVVVPTVQGEPREVPLWDRGVESLKKALQDGVLPETIGCSATQFS